MKDHVYFIGCRGCSDVGILQAVHKETRDIYGFRCYCPRGNKDWRNGLPQFNASFAKTYIVLDPSDPGRRRVAGDGVEEPPEEVKDVRVVDGVSRVGTERSVPGLWEDVPDGGSSSVQQVGSDSDL